MKGNATTRPLYNSSGEIIGTQAVTNNLNSHDSGTIVIVNTNQSISGSPTEITTMDLKNGLTNNISVQSSDGSVNINSSISYNLRTSEATVTTNDYKANTMNIMVYNVVGGQTVRS